jgi:VWFA-related protein
VAPSLPGDAGAEVDLAERYQAWLAEVALLITREERRAFLALERDYQREGFIDAFWEARGRAPGVPGEVFAKWHRQRLEEAVERFGSTEVDQAVVYILHGEPVDRLQTDCGMLLWPLDIWVYRGRTDWRREILVLFYQPTASGPYRMWHPREGLEVLGAAVPARNGPLIAEGGTDSRGRPDRTRDVLGRHCAELDHVVDKLRSMLWWLVLYGEVAYRVAQTPPRTSTEWLRTFQASATYPPPGAPSFTPELTLAFPGGSQGRALLRGTLAVPGQETAGSPAAAPRAFELFGEVLRDERLHETFRYRFELPPAPAGEPAALVFERLLRPGDYTLLLRLVDGVSGRQARLEEEVVVPALVSLGSAGPWEEAEEGLASAPSVLRLVDPGPGPHVGGLRIEAEVGPPTERVVFHLDDQLLLTRSRPPFDVLLALGRTPRSRTLRAVALDAGGEELAVDELVLNPAPHAFSLRLVEPRSAATSEAALPLRVDAVVPEGRVLERIELFVEERRVATLFQAPWSYEALLPPGPPPHYVLARGYLDDGSTAEATLALHGETPAGRLDVHLVEVYASVVDPRGLPVHDLEPSEVAVLEEGRPQTLLRFERVADLPLHVALLVDTSGSMEESIAAAQTAGLGFLESVLDEGDRGAVLTFSEVLRLAAPFTADRDELAMGLVGLHAEGGTALWDSILFALHYFQGLRGQRALLVLSDGEDHKSRHRFEDVVDYARHAGVTIYTLHYGSALGRRLTGGRQLARLAAETGGRAFPGEAGSGYEEVYRAIEEDLRSRYLLVYQSQGEEGNRFRRVEVRVLRPGHRARHMAGYLP